MGVGLEVGAEEDPLLESLRHPHDVDRLDGLVRRDADHCISVSMASQLGTRMPVSRAKAVPSMLGDQAPNHLGQRVGGETRVEGAGEAAHRAAALAQKPLQQAVMTAQLVADDRGAPRQRSGASQRADQLVRP